MLTSSRRSVVFSPPSKRTFSISSSISSNARLQPIKTRAFQTTQSTPPRSMQFLDVEQSTVGKNSRICGCSKAVFAGLVTLLALLIISAIVLAIALPLILTQTTLTTRTTTSTTTSTSTSTSASTSTSTSTSTTTTSTTTTADCPVPFVRTWPGTCVNLFLDDNNCGAIGSVCSNTSTHCSTGICSSVPTVQLLSYAPLWVGGNNGSIDDDVFNVTLPFNITLYNKKTSSVQMTTNGVLCFSNCSNTYQGTNLSTTNVFPDVTMFPCWADLYISAKTWQGLYVGLTSTAPTRQLTFEYYLSHFSAPTTYAHFNVRFFENRPNIVEFNYFQVDDQGTSCSVGVQAFNRSTWISYSYHQFNLTRPNMRLTFDTNFNNVTVT